MNTFANTSDACVMLAAFCFPMCALMLFFETCVFFARTGIPSGVQHGHFGSNSELSAGLSLHSFTVSDSLPSGVQHGHFGSNSELSAGFVLASFYGV